MAGFDATLRWINLRDSAVYVTDGANQYVCPGDGSGNAPDYAAPNIVTVNGAGVQMGWEAGGYPFPEARNRDSGVDPRLAGTQFVSETGSNFADFRVDLPVAGQWKVHLALGDAANGLDNYYAEIRDNTSVLAVVVNSVGTTADQEFWDASGVKRTSAADWVTNQAGVIFTFATTTLRIRCGTTANATGFTCLTTVGLQQIVTTATAAFPWVRA